MLAATPGPLWARCLGDIFVRSKGVQMEHTKISKQYTKQKQKRQKQPTNNTQTKKENTQNKTHRQQQYIQTQQKHKQHTKTKTHTHRNKPQQHTQQT